VRAIWILRVTRICILVAFACGVGLLVHRLKRTPEQRDLTHFVEVDVPRLRAAEQPVFDKVQRLDPKLTPEAARAVFVDEINPKLIALRKQAEGLRSETKETRLLIDEYLQVTDRLIDACRAAVRAIDDPELPGGAGYLVVKEHFEEVDRARRRWDAHVRDACVQHRLAPPGKLRALVPSAEPATPAPTEPPAPPQPPAPAAP
jgi:hypothetical protein